MGDAERECTCTPLQVQRYLNRLSGPLLDRFDIQIDVPRLTFNDLENCQSGESSAAIRRRVQLARETQSDRFGKAMCNADMSPSQLKKYCQLNGEASDLLRAAFTNLKLSARAHNKIIKVARTLADLAGCQEIQVEHVAEAVQYRGMERKFWNT